MKKDKNHASLYNTYRDSHWAQSCTFLLRVEPDAADISTVSKLNLMLRKMGGYADLHSHTVSGETYHYLSISIPENADKIFGRCAGRKKKAAYLPAKELRQMVADLGTDGAAARLGISRATLFRRLKDAENEDAEECQN